MLEQTKILSKAPIKINGDFQMPKIRVQESNSSREYVCTCCGKSYQRQDGNFLKAGSSMDICLYVRAAQKQYLMRSWISIVGMKSTLYTIGVASLIIPMT